MDAGSVDKVGMPDVMELRGTTSVAAYVPVGAAAALVIAAALVDTAILLVGIAAEAEETDEVAADVPLVAWRARAAKAWSFMVLRKE